MASLAFGHSVSCRAVERRFGSAPSLSPISSLADIEPRAANTGVGYQTQVRFEPIPEWICLNS